MATILCPYCKHRFEEEYYDNCDVPCPEETADEQGRYDSISVTGSGRDVTEESDYD